MDSLALPWPLQLDPTAAGFIVDNTLNSKADDVSDNSSRVEFELPMLEVGVRVPVVAYLMSIPHGFGMLGLQHVGLILFVAVLLR